MLLLGAGLKLTLLLLPFLIVLQGLLLWGLVLGLAALNVHYRDVQHLVGNVLTFLFFLCPIVYPANLVPARLHFTLEINPFALITLMYHDLILNETLPAVRSLVVLLGFILIFLVLGSWIYGRHRESFAEAL
jgi:ABC-type polysaccharide/polyol phosphate export permease